MQRPEAKTALARMDREAKHLHKVRLGRTRPQPDSFDVMLNSEHMDASQMAEVVQAAAAARRLQEQGLLAADAEAQIQFETRLKLARHGIVPAGHARLKRAAFSHPSEEVFANLLDFYRILGITNRAVSRYSGTRTAVSPRRSRPTSTCPNSTSTWNSPP